MGLFYKILSEKEKCSKTLVVILEFDSQTIYFNDFVIFYIWWFDSDMYILDYFKQVLKRIISIIMFFKIFNT